MAAKVTAKLLDSDCSSRDITCEPIPSITPLQTQVCEELILPKGANASSELKQLLALLAVHSGDI